MFGGIDPKQMQGMMKKMGISQEEVPAQKVTIEKSDGNLIIIENPSIMKIKMQGNTSFQISGDIKEVSREGEISKEDIETVMKKTGCSFKKAKETLEKTKDLAEAILKLST
ncbi:MAG: nascent polypeptide-associated complex protein [archaeon]|nr:nascent polypeptide-associated complex protein [archaeon]